MHIHVSIYIDLRDWWIGYYRGDAHHYVCLLPTLVVRWNRLTAPTRPFDCRQLLKKYIDHVGEEEGVIFLSFRPDGRFTDEEWAELQAISEERP